jgi:soluble lytic murein transglycosylase
MAATNRSPGAKFWGVIRVGLAAALLWTGPAPAAPHAAKKPPLPRSRPALPAVRQSVPLPRTVPLPPARPRVAGKALSAYAQANVGLRGALFASRATFKPLARPVSGPFSIAATAVTPAGDIAAVKRAIEAARKGKGADATAAEKTIADPVARKLAEWAILRSNNTDPPFQRYADFVNANPDWPHTPLFRRRAENALWNDNLDNATVLAFFARQKPQTAKGRYMLARALLAKGDRAAATALVRKAWRMQDCSTDVETRVLDMFGDLLTRADHKARMDKRFYVDDTEAGMRAAHRLGGGELALAKAWTATIKRKHNAKALLHAVPAATRHEAGYIYAHAMWLRREDKLEAAAKLMLSAPRDAEAVIDPDQWWQERRVLVRDLLDKHDPKSAYRVAIESVTPERDNYRVGKYFLAGWIALRYLHDAKTAATLFAHIPQGTDNPHALSRGGYWQGRAAEAMGHRAEADKFYRAAAEHSATYYGQLARARLGLTDLGLRGPPVFTAQERKVLGNLEVVRAAEILYALDERDLLASIFAEIGESGTDIAGMAMLAEVAAKHKDGRAMVLLGQYAHGRGLPLDFYAYPTVGLPDYRPIAPPIAPAVAYSIARQESHFNKDVVSPAHAMGLMQVTPIAGKDTARRYKVTYSKARLRSDPVYNMQMGAAELSNLLHYYDGSYLLTFAAYNAGRGRIRQWMEAYGDPRDPRVDPVDWVERLPYSETRNYVERIMENLQVYRALFKGSGKLMIEADLHRGKAD